MQVAQQPIKAPAKAEESGVEATEASLRTWFGAGIVACGIGSNLITKDLLDKQDYEGIEAKVRDTVAMIRRIRGK